nr:UvrD-helicase domain-containing protein [Propionibacterium sp.]
MMRPFSNTDPLPTGVTVLEASAGTGKTYAIAALAARFVAEGRAGVGDLLLVTFSRAATAELRTRVRERLQASAAALARVVDGGPPPTDAVDRLLGDADPAVVADRARRLAVAVDRFDQATIMTTHEFCHGMIRGLGVLAPQEPQSRLVEDLTPLADEAAADVYLRRYAFDDRPPPFGWVRTRTDDDPGARDIARDALAVDAVLGPRDAAGAIGERVAFAREVREEVAARKRRLRLFSFDDQLTRLRDALVDPVTGDLARRRLARRFPVVLIDEFQDTDPVQWQVIRSAFGHGSDTLVLIGDPKQAIYAFRFADVHTYGTAARSASTRTTLTRNYRADAAVVDAVAALFRGVLLGEEIDVPPVEAAHRRPRLVAAPGTPWSCGVQLRVVDAPEPVAPWVAARRVDADLTGVVTTLLGGRAPLRRPDGEPLRPADIAVLVRSNSRGRDVAAALSAAGVPATFSGTNSVFASDAAADWLTLLTALDQRRRAAVHRAVLTDFVGGSVVALATADEATWARWSEWLHRWGRALRRAGIPALVAAIERDSDLTARLLGRERGERDVTDHRHLAELLHRQESVTGVGNVRGLVSWLELAVDDTNAAAAERTRRLETDESAVQVMTIHRAKGLQFPVVLLPEASRDFLSAADDGGRIVLPTEDGRELDVGGRRGPGREDRWERQRTDEADESLRALYVGLTRAQSHVVAWWAHHWDTAASPLHRLLHANHAGPPRRPELAYDTRLLPGGGSPLTLPWLAEAGVAVVDVPAEPPASGVAGAGRPPELRARAWTRAIDQQWRRTSYSGLTAAAHAAAHEAAVLADEPAEPIAVDADPALGEPSPMAALPGGAAFGTLVHAVYESLDARGDDWRAALRGQVDAALRRWPLPGVAADTLTDALAPTLETPLGPLAAGTTLRSFGPRDRLTEFVFEFPLDAPGATLADVAALLAAHLPADDPLADYPDRLVGPTLTAQRLHGFLTGSIDAVLRLPDGGLLVVDYKTNRLAGAGEPLTVGHYSRPAMAEAMMASHYPLQALLYAVALHRHLRQRLPGYDPERHLAGTAYLFVRGMAGAATPVREGHPTGVFSWRPAPALVVELSRLLAGGAR